MLRFLLLISLLCLVSISPNLVLAEISADAGSSSSVAPSTIAALPPIDFTASLFSMVKGLAICIALLLGAVWLLKKLKSPLVTGQGRALKIIERLPVSTKSSILLVEVNKKKLLIGVGSDPVSLISDFVEGDALDEPSEILPVSESKN